MENLHTVKTSDTKRNPDISAGKRAFWGYVLALTGLLAIGTVLVALETELIIHFAFLSLIALGATRNALRWLRGSRPGVIGEFIGVSIGLAMSFSLAVPLFDQEQMYLMILAYGLACFMPVVIVRQFGLGVRGNTVAGIMVILMCALFFVPGLLQPAHQIILAFLVGTFVPAFLAMHAYIRYCQWKLKPSFSVYSEKWS